MKNYILKPFLAIFILFAWSNSYAQAFVAGDIPVDAVLYNPCCDEDIYVTGTMHIVINNNVEHLTVTNISGTGLSSGNSYTSHAVIVQNNIMYSNPQEGTLTFKANMVNEDGCSFTMKLTLHLTVNANGEVTASVEHVDFKCK